MDGGARTEGGLLNETPAATEVRDFLRHLADERQLSDHTVAAYELDLRQLTGFLTEYLAHADWRWTDPDIDRLALRGFMGWLGRKGLSKRTVGRKLSATRSFFRFLNAEGRMPNNPASAVRAPRTEKTLPGHLTRGDVRDVFSEAEKRAELNTLSTARDLVILELQGRARNAFPISTLRRSRHDMRGRAPPPRMRDRPIRSEIHRSCKAKLAG